MCCCLPGFRFQCCWPVSDFQDLRIYIEKRCRIHIIPCRAGSLKIIFRNMFPLVRSARSWIRQPHVQQNLMNLLTFPVSGRVPMMKSSSVGILSWQVLMRIPAMSICSSRLLTEQQTPGKEISSQERNVYAMLTDYYKLEWTICHSCYTCLNQVNFFV